MSKSEIMDVLFRELRPYFPVEDITIDVKCNRCVYVFIRVKGWKALKWLLDASIYRSVKLLAIGNSISLSKRDYKLSLVIYLSRVTYEPLNN